MEAKESPAGVSIDRLNKEMQMIRYNGINHLAMATGDMDATIRFWRDLLGMRLIGGFGKPGYRHYFFEISEKDSIAFFEWPDVAPAAEKEHGRAVAGPFIFDHVSFGIDKKETLWEIKDRLNAAGLWVSEVIDHGFIYSIYSFDPNGIPIEFSWNVEGVDIHKNPKMTDAGRTDIAGEGPDPLLDKWPGVKAPTPEQERKVYPGIGREYFRGNTLK